MPRWVPGATAVSRPAELIVAIPVFEEEQVTWLVTSWLQWWCRCRRIQ